VGDLRRFWGHFKLVACLKLQTDDTVSTSEKSNNANALRGRTGCGNSDALIWQLTANDGKSGGRETGERFLMSWGTWRAIGRCGWLAIWLTRGTWRTTLHCWLAAAEYRCVALYPIIFVSLITVGIPKQLERFLEKFRENSRTKHTWRAEEAEPISAARSALFNDTQRHKYNQTEAHFPKNMQQRN
jgi:hypothetical protein